MAVHQIGSVHGVNANEGQNKNGGDDDGAGFNSPNMMTVDAMRARLTAISSTSYSTSRLNAMTVNDMMYAIRVHDHAAGVN